MTSTVYDPVVARLLSGHPKPLSTKRRAGRRNSPRHTGAAKISTGFSGLRMVMPVNGICANFWVFRTCERFWIAMDANVGL